MAEQNDNNQSDKRGVMDIKNIILYGPPGTGKTYLHKYLINEIEKNGVFKAIKSLENAQPNDDKFSEELKKRYKFICFHQSYSYEDFIEGYRPSESEDKNNLIITRKDGIFKKFVATAINSKNQNCYLVIDEINRGNISKIFGELITLIEEDKRKEDWEVDLQYSAEPFYIPDNLYIIGTMNTADKSIANIDVALRRRFTFVRIDPRPDLVDETNIIKEQNKDKFIWKNLDNQQEPENLREWFENLNIFITKKLGRDYQIGHSYFMKIKTNEDLQFVLEYKIKPLMEEYFYHEDSEIKDKIDSYCKISIEECKETQKVAETKKISTGQN